MSMKAIGWAYDQDEKPGPKSVLLCLAWHADKTTWCSFPGVALMVRETGLRERAVAQHLDTLERRGLIRRERRHVDRGPGKGKRLSDVFQLLAPGVDQSANLAGELPANSADSHADATRNFSRDNPQTSSALSADSASAYIRIEPSNEPNAEPRVDAGGQDDFASLDAIAKTGGPLGEYARKMKRDLMATANKR